MNRAVIKFSSEDCGICHKMSFYDQKVAEELGLGFIDVKMQDTATYRQYRKILLTQYPDKAEMGWLFGGITAATTRHENEYGEEENNRQSGGELPSHSILDLARIQKLLNSFCEKKK